MCVCVYIYGGEDIKRKTKREEESHSNYKETVFSSLHALHTLHTHTKCETGERRSKSVFCCGSCTLIFAQIPPHPHMHGYLFLTFTHTHPCAFLICLLPHISKKGRGDVSGARVECLEDTGTI